MQIRHEKIVSVIFLLFFIFSGICRADIRLYSETIVRGFERDTAQEADRIIIPAYEYLQLDFGAIDTAGFSCHLYGWGRTDLSSSEYYTEKVDGELLYGYIEYVDPSEILNVTLGRQQISDGMSSDTVDGIRAGSSLPLDFYISLYGGLPASPGPENDRDGDSIVGGRFSHRMGSFYDIGISYKRLANNDIKEDERLGMDFFIGLPGNILFTGLSNLDLDSEQWAEHSYDLRFHLANFSIRPFYEKYQYENYFGNGDSGAEPFRYLADTGEILSAYGGDIFWNKYSSWDMGIKLKHYGYEERDASSLSASGMLTWHGKKMTRVGGEVVFMNGDDPKNAYTLGRGYFYWDQFYLGKYKGFISGDLIYVRYAEKIYNKEDSFFSSLAIGNNFLEESLEIKLTCDYTAGPYFDDDFRLMAVTTFLFAR